MTLSVGDNLKNFTAIMETNLTVALNAWVLALAFNPVHKGRLILKATDVSVRTMGLTFKGLTMRNELTCTAQCMTPDHPSCPNFNIPNSVCYPGQANHTPDQSPAVSVICESGEHDIKPPTTTTTTSGAAIKVSATPIGITV